MKTRVNMFRRIFVLIAFISIISCKSAKVSEGKIDDLPARVIVKKSREASFASSSIKASMSIRYKANDESTGLSASMRMIKDSVIWVSFSKLGIPLAKLMITPNEVQFYEKVGKSYFKGDFNLISEWMDAEFDFVKIQNLILGEPLISIEKGKYIAEIHDNRYQLVPKKRNAIFDIKYLFDPYSFRIVDVELNHREKKQVITVKYENFNRINDELLPREFRVNVMGEKNSTSVEANLKNIQLDVPLKFPFRIPDGYRRIILK